MRTTMTQPAATAESSHASLAAEVTRLREQVLDLGEHLTALTAETGRTRRLAAEVRRLRERVRDVDGGLTTSSAMTLHNRQEIKALQQALGLPAKSDAQEFAELMAIAGMGPQPGTGAQDHAHEDPVALEVQRQPSAAPPFRGSYEAAAAVQARRRAMHLAGGTGAQR